MDEKNVVPRPPGGKVATGVKIFITAIVSIVIQFGLAIVGWGGWSPFFAHPAMQALAWVTAGLTVASVFSGSSGLVKVFRKNAKTDGCSAFLL